ncbi:MAG: ABC transporter substrate-binding protein [Calditrichaceae bacterium]|nr:ABC transporter substrate-binding protein [Calditrichaceae bacterium]
MNNRRDFLKSASLSLGAVISTSPLISINSENKRETHKVGILLPTSIENAHYPDSYLNGISLAFKNTSSENKRIEIVTETVMFGYPSQAIKKTRKLIKDNRVNCIVGLLNTEVAHQISEITGEVQMPVFISNAGENFPSKGMMNNPNLYFNSLSMSHNASLAGKFMIENFGKKIAIVASLYDAGYDTMYAFRRMVEQQSGCIPIVFINDNDNPGFNEQTLSRLAEDDTDGLFLLMNGKAAASFLLAYQQKGINIPIVTTSFVTDESMLLHLSTNINNVYHFSSWIKNLDNSVNKQFVAAYRNEYNKEPDQFAVLGFETGLIVDKILVENKNKNQSKQICIDAPSGKLTVNTEFGYVQSPSYLCKVKTSGFLIPENTILEKINIEDSFINILSTDETNLHSGWLNPYLFV